MYRIMGSVLTLLTRNGIDTRKGTYHYPYEYDVTSGLHRARQGMSQNPKSVLPVRAAGGARADVSKPDELRFTHARARSHPTILINDHNHLYYATTNCVWVFNFALVRFSMPTKP